VFWLFSVPLLITGLIWLVHIMRWPRDPDYIIGPKEDPQVKRWWVIPRNPIFNIYLHKFCRSDDDRALHDHPWCNVSFVLKGEYLEIVPDSATRTYKGVRRYINATDGKLHANHTGILRRPFRPVFRFAKQPHRVMLFGYSNPVPCWSLFFTGPNLRTWGFYCPDGYDMRWVPWQQFIERYEGGNERGKGCD